MQHVHTNTQTLVSPSHSVSLSISLPVSHSRSLALSLSIYLLTKSYKYHQTCRVPASMKVCSACADVWRMLKYVDVCWHMQACRVLANMTACSNRTLWEISMRLVFTCVFTHTHTHTHHTHIFLTFVLVCLKYMHGCKLCVLRVRVCLYFCFCLRDWLQKIKYLYVRAHAKSSHTKPTLTNAPSCYWDWGCICCGKLSTHASLENAYIVVLRTHLSAKLLNYYQNYCRSVDYFRIFTGGNDDVWGEWGLEKVM